MANGMLTVYGTTWCGDCHRAKRVLDQHGIRYRWIDIEADPLAAALVPKLNGRLRVVPTIVLPDGSVLVEPRAAGPASEVRA